MDAFKTIVVISILIAVIAVGFIAIVANDAIKGAKIPDGEYGIIADKGQTVENIPVNYYVALTNGKRLYIPMNTTLYNSLQINKSYLFNCRIDYTNQRILIDSAYQQNRTAP